MLGIDLLGAPTLDDARRAAATAEAEVQAVGKHVSPWLWILSIGAFGMAALNRYQIAHATGGSMFGSFSGLKAALKRKRQGGA